MYFSLKALIVVASAAVSACAISYPLIMNRESTVRTNNSIESRSGVYQIDSETDQEYKSYEGKPTLENKDDEENDKAISFDELGNGINARYVDEQEDGGKEMGNNQLTGGSKLKEIIQPSVSVEKRGKTITEDGKICDTNKSDSTTFCGFLEIEDDSQNNSYKIKIDLKNGEWQVTVAKPTKDEYIETYNKTTQKWEINNSIDFDSLTTFKEKESTGGENVHEISFTDKQ